MLTKTVTVKLRDGLVQQDATHFIQKANEFKSRVSVMQGDHTVNAKSLLGLLHLGIKYGEEVQICAAGPDEVEAVEVLTHCLAASQQAG